MLKHFKQWLLSRLNSNRLKRFCCWTPVVLCPWGEMFPSNLASMPLRSFSPASIHWILNYVDLICCVSGTFLFWLFLWLQYNCVSFSLHFPPFRCNSHYVSRYLADSVFFHRPSTLHHSLMCSLLGFLLLLFWFLCTFRNTSTYLCQGCIKTIEKWRQLLEMWMKVI